MTLSQQMMQTARLASHALGEAASDQVASFINKQICSDGGFADRAGNSDLYYSVFGLEALRALEQPVPPHCADFLTTCLAHIDLLDLVHLGCLLRCRRDCGLPIDENDATLLQRVLAYRSTDGGFAMQPGQQCCSTYATFIAVDAHDLAGVTINDSTQILSAVENARNDDGSYSATADTSFGAIGTTPTTAAGMVVRHRLGATPDAASIDWLCDRRAAHGGFSAIPRLPLPDLLSTAVALQALSLANAINTDWHEPTLDFVDSLWDDCGAFHCSWADTLPDLEYTWYGLLCLGSCLR